MLEVTTFSSDILNNCEFAIDEVCRTCFTINEVMFSADQYLSNEKIKFEEMLLDCLSIEIHLDGKLPKLICEKCATQIESFYEFKCRSRLIENTLRAKLVQVDDKKDDDFKIEIADEKLEINDTDIEFFGNTEIGVSENDDSDPDDIPLATRQETSSSDEETENDSKIEQRWFRKVKVGFECTLCSELSTQRRLLKMHVTKVHGHLFTNKCKYCNQIFNKKYSLRRHELSHQTKLKTDGNDSSLTYEISGPTLEERTKAEEQIEKLDKSLYLCKICNKTKTNLTNIVNHIYFHLQIKHFKCPHCDKKFVTSSNVNRHIKVMHSSSKSNKKCRKPPQVHHCDKCSQVFKTLRLFETHQRRIHGMRIRSGYDPVNCEYCNQKCYNNTALRKHINGIHLIKEFKCDLCTRSFRSEKGLMGHRRVHGEKTGFHCKFCMFSSELQEELDKHYKVSHQDAKIYSCHLCSKEFYVEYYLKKHIRNHTAKPNHLCTICGKTFLLKSNLRSHIRIHTGEKPYRCVICNASFSQHSALRFHQGVHNETRNFECTICGSTWKRKIDLTQHMKVHSTAPPHHSCHFCGKLFVLRKRLTAHMRAHTDEKRYKCEICDKSFRRVCHLKVHSNVHTGERPYQCNICGKGFIQNHCLTTHINNHHRTVTEISELEYNDNE